MTLLGAKLDFHRREKMLEARKKYFGRKKEHELGDENYRRIALARLDNSFRRSCHRCILGVSLQRIVGGKERR